MKKKPAVDMSKTYMICRAFTGATGLEPATSGVTGQFSEHYMDDDRRAIRLITSIFEADRAGPA